MANKVSVNHEVCKGCGLCVYICPKKVMELDREQMNSKGYFPTKVQDMTKCIACGMCATMCPDSAIKVEKE